MKKKVAMFPGQGNVYVGMCKDLLKDHDIARSTFEEASDAIHIDLKELCLKGDLKDLTKTENAQPAILTASTAAFRVLWEEFGFRPHYYAGHSLGEFSALTCAGYLPFAQAVALVKRRGELMRDAAAGSDGIMSAVGKVPKAEIQAVCEELSTPESVVCISNFNSVKQSVISGHKNAVMQAEKRLSEMGAAVKRLNVSAPFHSPLMAAAVEPFKELIDLCTFRESKNIVLSNVTAAPHVFGEMKLRLAQQLVSPVRWVETMDYLKTQEVRVAVDVGPGKVLRNLTFDNFPGIKALSYDVADNARELEKLLGTEKPVPFISRCMGLAVAAQNFNHDSADYEKQVIEPYRRLQLMQQTIEAEERSASMEEMKTAKELLLTIFRGKGTPTAEQQARLEKLYLDTDTQVYFS